MRQPLAVLAILGCNFCAQFVECIYLKTRSVKLTDGSKVAILDISGNNDQPTSDIILEIVWSAVLLETSKMWSATYFFAILSQIIPIKKDDLQKSSSRDCQSSTKLFNGHKWDRRKNIELYKIFCTRYSKTTERWRDTCRKPASACTSSIKMKFWQAALPREGHRITWKMR